MATPYTATSTTWQPEMNNTRYPGRYASVPRSGSEQQSPGPSDGYRSITPNRYMAYHEGEDQRTPSSTGLIRLSLKKPMGIVFEPMYDPNKPSDQRGVRICDLPRTGAAALSRKLHVGDELLQINDTTVSRMTFDEIMDFIIEADPESVNLLFRRPRKETLQARQGIQLKLNAAANKDAPNTVKWVDEERGDKKKPEKKEKKKDKNSKRSKKESTSEEEETLQSSTADGDSYAKAKLRSKKKTRARRNPVESESFLDILIDSICSDSSNMCRDTFRRNDDEYISDDDDSFGTELNDEETYATIEESLDQRAAKKLRPKHFEEESTQQDNTEKHRRPKSGKKEKAAIPLENAPEVAKKYEDDGTLETVETNERPKDDPVDPAPVIPLGLSPNPTPTQDPAPQPARPGQSDTDDDGNPAPIRELEYDDRIDHGADVSVMESLGGPSLLIEKQRAAQVATQKAGQKVPAEIMTKFGLDYVPDFDMTREQTIEADPLRYYTFVVRRLLEQHEPEKVRLLDKLLAKYKGREDHLIQKLSVRYSKTNDDHDPVPEETDEAAFSDAVKKGKASSAALHAVNMAREQIQLSSQHDEEMHRIDEWPEKETKEPDEGDEDSESESEYSRESIDGTSPAVIAQVSELLNYVYGKTSVPGQIDRVSTIMRAYEGREAVLLELLETKALIKANKEKGNSDSLPSFLRNSHLVQSSKHDEEIESTDLPPVTPMATQAQSGTGIHDDISSMSGVSFPAGERMRSASQDETRQAGTPTTERSDGVQALTNDGSKISVSSSKVSTSSKLPPVTPDKRKKKGIFGGLFGGLKKTSKDQTENTPSRTPGSMMRNSRKLKGVKSVEGSI